MPGTDSFNLYRNLVPEVLPTTFTDEQNEDRTLVTCPRSHLVNGI